MKNVIIVLIALSLFSCNRQEQYKKHGKERERVVIIDKNILPQGNGDPNFVLSFKDSMKCYDHASVSDSLYYNVKLGDTLRVHSK